jgi:hypothetical protein
MKAIAMSAKLLDAVNRYRELYDQAEDQPDDRDSLESRLNAAEWLIQRLADDLVTRVRERHHDAR